MAKGRGIPGIERFIGRILLSRWCAKHPPEATMPLVRQQHDALLTLMTDAGSRAGVQVSIKRLPGLEASSINYSLAMVADHLARVNTDLATTIQHLARGEPCPIVVSTANYKPAPGTVPDRARADLELSLSRLDHALADTAPIRRSRVTHTHPWFGALPASTWACFPSFHQEIHLKQARLIAAGL